MSVLNQIKKVSADCLNKQWYDTYWAFDIHGTILMPSYNLNDNKYSFYPYAKETLQYISNNRKDINMILYTCSYPHEIKTYLDFFENNDIYFKHVNENPNISSNRGNFGFYEKKFYFNVLFEDKAGFDPFIEWQEIYEYLLTCKFLPDPNWTTKF
jgi:hypothetical protein